MKSMILVALALVAVAAALPVVEEPVPILTSALPVVEEPIPILTSALPVAEEPIPILTYEFKQQPDGGYVFRYESGDGGRRDEQGEVKEVLDEEKKPHNVIVVSGSYGYIGKDDKPVVVTYSADELGYKAEGDSIPKSARR